MSLDFRSRETQAYKWTFVSPTSLWDVTLQTWKHITFNFCSPFWSQNVLRYTKKDSFPISADRYEMDWEPVGEQNISMEMSTFYFLCLLRSFFMCFGLSIVVFSLKSRLSWLSFHLIQSVVTNHDLTEVIILWNANISNFGLIIKQRQKLWVCPETLVLCWKKNCSFK